MNTLDILNAKQDRSNTIQLLGFTILLCISIIAASILFFETSNEHELRLKVGAIILFSVQGVLAGKKIYVIRKTAPVYFERNTTWKALAGLILAFICMFIYTAMAFGGIPNPF